MIKNAITYHVEMPTNSFDMYQFMADTFYAMTQIVDITTRACDAFTVVEAE